MTDKTEREAAGKRKSGHHHYGHRDRKKEEFLLSGLDGKTDHEILEIMLFYCIPVKDTNDIAHELINQFGSLKSVINAPYEELLKVNGIKEHAASMICFFRLLAKRYFVSVTSEKLDLSDMHTLSEYCKALFITADTEEVHMIFLDDDLHLIREQKLCEGTLGKVDLSFRVIAEAVIRAKSNRVVLTHNHPNGSCMPSRMDVNTTKEIWHMLNQIQVELIDHVIVGREGEWSMNFHRTMPEIWGF